MWDDPPFKDIMKPGIQLRVYVGADDNNGHEIYYWIDCPAQMHKLLIPKDDWLRLKDALIDAGHTAAKIMIVYRTIEGGDDAADEGQFFNRGHSNWITVDLGVLQ